MRWYSDLYLSKTAQKYRDVLIKHIDDHRSAPQTYLITPASNKENILDIYTANELMSPFMESKGLLIIGIAMSKKESLELAGTIVSDLYEKTGGFCLRDLIPEA